MNLPALLDWTVRLRAVEPFLERVRELDPDLLFVVEADRWWQRALAPLRASYAHSIEHPQEDTYGMLLYSKLALEEVRVRSYTTRLFRRISGMLDPRIGRGLFATFPAARPWLRFPLDHLFHTAELGLLDLRCVPIEGSDHLSIYARLGFAARVEEAVEVPTPEPGDLELASEKIEQGLSHDA